MVSSADVVESPRVANGGNIKHHVVSEKGAMGQGCRGVPVEPRKGDESNRGRWRFFLVGLSRCTVSETPRREDAVGDGIHVVKWKGVLHLHYICWLPFHVAGVLMKPRDEENRNGAYSFEKLCVSTRTGVLCSPWKFAPASLVRCHC